MLLKPNILILGRAWCHLCQDMIDAVKARVHLEKVILTVLDIDENPDLEKQWDEWVPVLFVDDHYVCHYHLDENAFAANLPDECLQNPVQSSV